MAALQVLTFGGRAHQLHQPRDVENAGRQKLNSILVTSLLADVGGRVQATRQTLGAATGDHFRGLQNPQRSSRNCHMFSDLLSGIGAQAQAAQHISGTSDNVFAPSPLADIGGRRQELSITLLTFLLDDIRF